MQRSSAAVTTAEFRFSPLSFRKREKRREEEEAAFPISTSLFSHSEMCARNRRGSVPFSRIIFAISSISAGGSSIPKRPRRRMGGGQWAFFLPDAPNMKCVRYSCIMAQTTEASAWALLSIMQLYMCDAENHRRPGLTHHKAYRKMGLFKMAVVY